LDGSLCLGCGEKRLEVLIEKDCSVTVVDNFSYENRSNISHLKSRFDFVNGDIWDRQSQCHRSCSGFVHIFTGKDLILAPRKVVTFKWSEKLKEKLNTKLITKAKKRRVKKNRFPECDQTQKILKFNLPSYNPGGKDCLRYELYI